MRIIAISTLVRYYHAHPEAEQPLKAWIAEVKKADWQNAHDIKAKYKNASVLKNRRVVFNIKGNEHRLIVAIAFKIEKICLIPFLKIIQYEPIKTQQT
ncbi:type II toxin-antitoxin system HigB family toxin [Histophilus somni]|uniref:mRNA interferase HigB n=1 Tax=Histophilus somni (strain 129Pt) TaxID=205914 RepID=Q0I216_HISS1|nr:type II toxin-antitoxin system HigB family toxin [Histophilus somni]QEH10922.1 type II toxin-antitoxin system HigB family toxin [Histophilus somni]QEH16388.1 type II toxin-antitoxin system HigB family toxin [Histophilus somni]QEH21799.1 type II toxin-antitoxin system HigB family toxin [Histophilus somni]QEH50973.1 type II toxin-antitoxin system HigB family toxin [Histophilus somni]TFI33043.1 type II toxin-antitoxin system HigB family toxin [Histophilus somni]